jgi:hypothetical protein
MRFYLVAILSIMFAACQPQLPGAGTENHPCRTGITWAGACNDDLRCVDGTCLSCGDDGEACCAIAGGSEYCHGNMACEGGNGGLDGVLGECTTDCGIVGMPCCPGFDECPTGGQCVSGMCEADPVDSCLNGSTKHVMTIITGDCTSVDVIFYTNTVEEAESCRQHYVDIALPTEEICLLDQEPELTNVCASSAVPPDSPYQLWNCSAAQLQTCEQYWCSNCTWTTGDCP